MKKPKKKLVKSDSDPEDEYPLNGKKKKIKKKGINKSKKSSNANNYEIKKIRLNSKYNDIKSKIYWVLLIIIIIIIIYFLFMPNNKVIENLDIYKIDKIKERNINIENIDYIEDEEIEKIKKYIKKNLNGVVGNSIKYINKSNNPKISIVISLYNGEPFIKTAILSIENQNFKDIEIIVVDDCSTDNSVNIIKELMDIDSRIIFFQNKENKGALYTKTFGVLNAKGKYVMILEQDDLYAQNNAFITLYDEAEKDNLYILGFASMLGGTNIKNENLKLNRYIDAPIIFQPYISRRMYVHNSEGKIIRNGDILSNYFFKTSFFIRSIQFIKDYLDIKMNYHEDFLLFFLLTRNAYNLKQIKKIFYYILERPINNDPKIIFHNKEKIKNRDNTMCLNYLYYAEFLLNNTINSIYDKKIASFELENWFLNHKCKNSNNLNVREEAKKVCNLFLENQYIEEEEKNKIKNYLNGNQISGKNDI